MTQRSAPGKRRPDGPAHRRPNERDPRRYRYALGWAGVAVCAVVVAAQALAGSAARGTREEGGPVAGSGDAAGMVSPPSAPAGPTGSPAASPSPTRTQPPRRVPRAAAPARPSRKPRRTPPRVTISSPPQGTEVHGQAGVTLTGTATGLGGSRLRIFELAPDGLYYVADEGQVPVHAGRWRFHNGTIGSGAQDVGKVFTTIAVIADAACGRTLAAAVPNGEGNVVYRTLPPGCREGDSVRVRKVAP